MAARQGSSMIGLALAAVAVAALSDPQQVPFRSAVEVVEVDVSVMRGGKPVTGLTAENFRLTDNGVPQAITGATLDRLPLNVFLVLDISGSVAGERLASLVDAGMGLMQTLRPDDRAALVTFSDQVRVDVALTKDASSIGRALTGLSAHGGTSLHDAVHVALQVRPLETTRSVVIVFTDGRDTMSWLQGPSVVDEARRMGVVIHAIELSDPPVLMPDGPGRLTRQAASRPAILEQLTAASGGRIWSATSPRDLRSLFTQALEEMRARYLLTFTPSGRPQEGWHELKVSLQHARGDVTARTGYFVASER
jgi:Ca-activated chloride channel homolog